MTVGIWRSTRVENEHATKSELAVSLSALSPTSIFRRQQSELVGGSLGQSTDTYALSSNVAVCARLVSVQTTRLVGTLMW